MAINFRSSTRVSNLRVGPLSGGGGSGGGGGGSVQFAMGAGSYGSPSEGRVYLFDPTNLSSSTGIASNPYGSSRGGSLGRGGIAIDGTTLVAASDNQQDANSNGYGSLFVYDTNNLSSTPTELTNPLTEVGASFGHPIAISSDYIAASSPYSNYATSTAGAVVVYDRSNLSSSPTIVTANDAQGGDYFGTGLALTSTHLIVGSPHDDDDNSNSGALYFYDVTNLSAAPTKIIGTGYRRKLGSSIATNGTTVVAGAAGDAGGNLYVYDTSNLSAAPTVLTPSGVSANDSFGQATAITANHIIGGAPYDDVTGNNAGAVYVYDRSNLSATPTVLRPSDGAANDYFGNYLAANGNHLIVGAWAAEGNSLNNIGAVYVYDLSNLSAAPTKVQPTSLTDGSYFGNTVAIG